VIEINLLPRGDARRVPARRAAASTSRALPKLPALGGDPWIVGLSAVGVLLLLVFAFGFWRTGARQSALRAQIEEEVADSVRLSSAIQLAETLRARQDTIAQKIAVIRQVDERRYVWPHVMDEISKSVPAFTWLTRLNSTEARDSSATGPSLTLEGNAGSTQALTRLMKNLEASPYLRDVTLVTSAQATEEGRSFQRFTLEARYERPDSSLVETIPIVVAH
jgi:Tfp pilus assembly protein PilN